jgi:signal transduction histidine kinase
LNLTIQLLDFRKTEMHEFGLNFVNTHMMTLLAEQIEMFRDEADRRKLRLSVQFPEKDFIAYVDKEAFVKIIGNLMSNAIKYAGSQVNIQLLVSNEEHENFTVIISNDGKVIPKELSNKIFEPFFRVNGNEQPGTGIGLSLAKSLTELHNGRLELVQTEEKLNIFKLTLPLRQKFEFKLSKWEKING